MEDDGGGGDMLRGQGESEATGSRRVVVFGDIVSNSTSCYRFAFVHHRPRLYLIFGAILHMLTNRSEIRIIYLVITECGLVNKYINIMNTIELNIKTHTNSTVRSLMLLAIAPIL